MPDYADPDSVQNPGTGDVVTAALLDQYRENLEFLIEPPQFSAQHSTTQNVSDSTPTVLLANTEIYDTASMHSTSTNSGRGTAPIDGKYLCVAVVQKPDTNTAGRIIARFQVNGTTEYPCVTLTSESFWTATIVRTLALSAGDYVEIEVAQFSGGTRVFQLLEFSMRFQSR